MFLWILLQLLQSYNPMLMDWSPDFGWLTPRHCNGSVRKILDLSRLDKKVELVFYKGSNKLKTYMLYNGQDVIWLLDELWRIGTCARLRSTMLMSSILLDFADYTKEFVFKHSLFLLNLITPMMSWYIFLNQLARMHLWINWDCEAWRNRHFL